MSGPYVPLRLFSCYTMLEGAMEPKAIAGRARALGFPAAAVADRNGLYGVMPFSDACLEEGVQPIVGAMLGVARPGSRGGPGDHGVRSPPIDWLALYAQDEAGYANLSALVSAAHLDRPADEDAHVPLSALAGRTDGLIALTAGGEGALARLVAHGQDDAATSLVAELESLFPGRLYIELSRRGDRIEEAAEAGLIELAYARNLPLVATNPAAYAEAQFHAAHDAMLCIAQSSQIARDDRETSSAEAWIKPADEMARLFADLPEAIANSGVIARRCAFAAPRRDPILPSIAGDGDAEAAQLRRDAREGLEARLAGDPSIGADERQVYLDRLDFELDVIIKMGFAAYFLIVADFIKWAKGEGIPVGPGRGSGAGSVVAWSLTITDLDPIRLGLLFERFLNPERVSMPDFDIDFCETRRGEVLRYVQQRYGNDRVAQIITFGTMKARAVLKDTGRVLQMPYGQVDRLAKLVPNHPTDPWTLERALNGVTELAAEYRNDPDVRRLFDLAMKLEGLPRHSSTHAAGVVIADRPLEQLVPLYRDPRSDMPVTQFDMKYVEKAGLVKFDFLGLKTLSVLRRASDLLAARGIEVDLDRLAPWDDPLRLCAAPAGRHGGRVPAGIGRDAADPGGRPAHQLRRHHRPRRPLPAGADGQHPDVRRPQERPRVHLLSASAARGAAEGDLRHLRLPGAGDGGGQDPGRLQPGRGRSPAPRHGQEDQVGDGRPAVTLRRGLRREEPDSGGEGERTVRPDRQVRRLWLQQEPRGRLRPRRLSDGLAEGAPPA